MNIKINENLKLWGEEIIYSILILLGFWLLARFARYFLAKWVLRFTKHTETELDDKIIEAVKSPIYCIILLFGISLAISVLPLPAKIISIGNGIIYIIGVCIGVFIAYRVVSVFLEWYTNTIALKTNTQIEREFLPLIEKVIFVFILITGLIVVLKHFNYDILSLVTALGVASMAIGLAAKDTLANMISGFTLMVDRPFRVGDRIQLAGGEIGDVTEIGLRCTRIRTFESNILVVPNTELVNTKVINQCFPDSIMRAKARIGVAYGSNIEKVKQIMLETANGHPQVVKTPPPIALFTEFADSSLTVQMFYWVKNCMEIGIVQDEVNCQIKKRFEEDGIEMPFRSRYLYRAS
ncbi:MAG: mechanosensitive ion channel family protein [Deltaproteobacteria bacterium]|nr:mechanosensitive ion channel family protein [Deltaproteobacteria bacterium]